MRKSRFSEEKIIAFLKEVENGARIADVCCRHGVSEQTYFRWKRKYGGLDVDEARRLRSLEDENRRLKQIVADLTPEEYAAKHSFNPSTPSQQPYLGLPESLVLTRGAGQVSERRNDYFPSDGIRRSASGSAGSDGLVLRSVAISPAASAFIVLSFRGWRRSSLSVRRAFRDSDARTM
jgi:putative transposase